MVAALLSFAALLREILDVSKPMEFGVLPSSLLTSRLGVEMRR
jgi:hypothetical protein